MIASDGLDSKSTISSVGLSMMEKLYFYTIGAAFECNLLVYNEVVPTLLNVYKS